MCIRDSQPRCALTRQDLALPEVAVQQEEFGGILDQLLARRESGRDERFELGAPRRGGPHALHLSGGALRDGLEGVAGRRVDPQPPHRAGGLQQRLRLGKGAQGHLVVQPFQQDGLAGHYALRSGQELDGAPAVPVCQRRPLERGSGPGRRDLQHGGRAVLPADQEDEAAAPAGGTHPVEGDRVRGQRLVGECGEPPEPVGRGRVPVRLAERSHQTLRRFETHTCLVPFRSVVSCGVVGRSCARLLSV